MTHIRNVVVLAWVFVVGLSQARAQSPASASPAPRAIDFAREIRPILSENCFACHGPDNQARKGGLRLDDKDGAFGKAKSGSPAIIAGKPDDSELVFRVETDDPDLMMPPKASGKTLTAEQRARLRHWVEDGAKWSSHWAFEPPRKLDPPAVKSVAWPNSAIDRFILARAEAVGLTPEPEADRETLIRAVTLDLTGLPPTIAEVDAFLADRKAGAYERVVDRLLRSPRYGEHMARYWLDAARYGDTHGLHLDNYREMWPYRDWVIRAFNDNKPYDRFLIEQLAGDLLPNPTPDQIIATGFNRCHVSTSEGGSIEEEVYVRNIVDQVDTNGTVLLGLTTGCARCHDHKYDPIRSKDYYQLFAFFNNIDGPALDGNSAKWAPIVKAPTMAQGEALAVLDGEIAALQKTIAAETERYVKAHPVSAEPAESEVVRRADYVWIDDEPPRGATPQGDGAWEFVSSPESPVHAGRLALKQTAKGRMQRFFENAAAKLTVGEGDVLFAYVYLDPLNPPREVMLQWHTKDGWARRAYWGQNLIDWGKDQSPERLAMGELPASGEWARLEVKAASLSMPPGTVVDGWAFTQFDGTAYWDSAGIKTWTPQDGQRYDTFAGWIRGRRADKGKGLPAALKPMVELEKSRRTPAQTAELYAYYLANGSSRTAAALEPLAGKLRDAIGRRKAIDDQVATTLVFSERKGEPKPAFILKRGEYDQKGEKVGRAVPAFLPPLPAGAPVDRMGLALWLTAANHPLTARVAVNRFWQQVFGTGIVKTSEDFGAQGEPPSHPELLDWLAVDFREHGWDVKRLMKGFVMSATYRQGRRATPEGLAKDPANRLLARGPRFRLDAETLRDQALFVGGLLVDSMGGPSVKPPQPAGLWEAVGYSDSNTARFTADSGVQKVHRRSIYTFWKRTSPPPQMTTFDAPSRESCQVRRERTNTPLQALLLLNEEQFVEAARGLALRTLREGGSNAEDRLNYLFRLVAARRPDAQELAELTATLRDLEAHYKDRMADAKKLVGGVSPGDPRELAAWILLGNVVLNLDLAITKG